MLKTPDYFMLCIVLFMTMGLLPGAYATPDIVLVDFNTAQETIPQGWELVVNQGNANLRLTPEDDGQVLHLRSHNASFALQKELHLELQDTPYLIWTWKVTQLPSGGDFRQRKTDDQAAQLIVSFSATRFISYIWDSTAPKDLFGKAPSPPFRKIMAWVVQSGAQALGEWKTERRNLVDDYRRLFGEAPETLRGLRIQINSQHTQSHAAAAWKSIILSNGRQQASQIHALPSSRQPIDTRFGRRLVYGLNTSQGALFHRLTIPYGPRLPAAQ